MLYYIKQRESKVMYSGDNQFKKQQYDEGHVISETDKHLMEVGDYLYGSCHLFALELAQQTGLKIGAFIEEDDVVGEVYLQHAFCYHPVDPDKVIDCRGVVEKEFIFDDYCSGCDNAFEIEDEAEQFLKDGVSSGKFHDWAANLLLDPDIDMSIEKEKEVIADFIKQGIKDNIYPTQKPIKPKSKRRQSP